MIKPFDVATKQLVESDPVAWLRFFGLPGESAELTETDLSTVVADADRVLRVVNPDYIAHIELQSTYETDIGDRTLLYNVFAYRKYGGTVESALLLLRKSADGPGVSGRVEYGSLSFEYRVARIWERSPEELLGGPLALLPLAPLTKVVKRDLPGVIRRMEERIDTEAPAESRGLLWTTTWLLLGLKFDASFSSQLLQGVIQMEESTTYQYTVQQGRVQEARRILYRLGSTRLGEPDAATRTVVELIDSPDRLEQLIDNAVSAGSWRELLQ